MEVISVIKPVFTSLRDNKLCFLTNGPNRLPFIIPLPEDKNGKIISKNLLKLITNVQSYINKNFLLGSRKIEYLIYNEANIENCNLGYSEQQLKKLAVSNFNCKSAISINDDIIKVIDHEKTDLDLVDLHYLIYSVHSEVGKDFFEEKHLFKSSKNDRLWQVFKKIEPKNYDGNSCDNNEISKNKMPIICLSETNSQKSISEELRNVILEISNNQNYKKYFYRIAINNSNQQKSQTIAILASSDEDNFEEFEEFFDNSEITVSKFEVGQSLNSEKVVEKVKENDGTVMGIDKSLIYIGVLVLLLSMIFAKLTLT